MRTFKNGSRHLKKDEVEYVVVNQQETPRETWGDRIKREYLGGK